jgi:hypothetical protein
VAGDLLVFCCLSRANVGVGAIRPNRIQTFPVSIALSFFWERHVYSLRFPQAQDWQSVLD